MLSYTTPQSILRANAEAARIMEGKGHGVDRAAPKPGARTEDLAKAHSDALARRKAG